MSNPPRKKQGQLVGFLGLGLDHTDREKRVTTSEHFLLIGGSEETHGRMQETAVKFNQALRQRGKRLQDTSLEEAVELLHQSQG